MGILVQRAMEKSCNYEPGEVVKSHSKKGILDVDVAFAGYFGIDKPSNTIVIADFVVERSRILRPSTKAELNTRWIGTFKKADTLEVIGYSDCTGSELYNASLREKRAQGVSHIFGPSGPTIRVIGAG